MSGTTTVAIGSSEEPEQLPTMRVSTVDTRGLDLYPALYSDGDTLASIASIAVARSDGLPLAAGDLSITPAHKQAPWIGPNPAGVDAAQVNWWQGVGTAQQIIATAAPVDYLVTVSVATVGGRALSFDVVQTVSSALG